MNISNFKKQSSRNIEIALWNQSSDVVYHTTVVHAAVLLCCCVAVKIGIFSSKLKLAIFEFYIFYEYVIDNSYI